jgi:hypothetical protein
MDGITKMVVSDKTNKIMINTIEYGYLRGNWSVKSLNNYTIKYLLILMVRFAYEDLA